MDYYGFTEVQTSWKDTNFLGLVRCVEENTKGRGEKGGGERKGESESVKASRERKEERLTHLEKEGGITSCDIDVRWIDHRSSDN